METPPTREISHTRETLSTSIIRQTRKPRRQRDAILRSEVGNPAYKRSTAYKRNRTGKETRSRSEVGNPAYRRTSPTREPRLQEKSHRLRSGVGNPPTERLLENERGWKPRLQLSSCLQEKPHFCREAIASAFSESGASSGVFCCGFGTANAIKFRLPSCWINVNREVSASLRVNLCWF